MKENERDIDIVPEILSMPDNYLLIGNALSGDLVPRKVAACAIKDEAPIGRAVIWP